MRPPPFAELLEGRATYFPRGDHPDTKATGGSQRDSRLCKIHPHHARFRPDILGQFRPDLVVEIREGRKLPP